MRATAAPPRGFDVATSIGTDGRRSPFYGGRAAQASEAGRILSSVPGADERPRRQSGASQTYGGRIGRPRGRRRGLGGHGPGIALHGWHGWNGPGPRPDRVLRHDLGRDDGGDDVTFRDPGGPRVRANGRTAKGMAGCHWSACRYVPRRVADLRRGVLRDLHRGENALAEPGSGGWTGSGSGRPLFPQPDQTGEPGPLPRAVRAAWAASLQPDAERRCGRRALRPQLSWMQRGAHGGHGPRRDVQSVVGGDPGHRRPHLQARASAATAI